MSSGALFDGGRARRASWQRTTSAVVTTPVEDLPDFPADL
jgi:hypothetical protein